MTPAEIAALRALMERATPGTLPLRADVRVMARAVGADDITFASFGGAGDRGPEQWGAHRDLTVAAVNALPALLSLAEDAARLRAALAFIEGREAIADDVRGFVDVPHTKAMRAMAEAARAALAPAGQIGAKTGV